MGRIAFTSSLRTDYRRRLESLLFFNPGQHRVRSAVLAAIEVYSLPVIIVQNGRLRVQLKSGREVHALFAVAEGALRQQLVGVVVYTRLDSATILVLHMAVTEEYSLRGSHGGEMLLMQLIEQLIEIARGILGVRTVRLLYAKGQTQYLSVESAPTKPRSACYSANSPSVHFQSSAILTGGGRATMDRSHEA